MRIEPAGLRTWWLGGCALWALALWVATWFGLGTRIEPLPADPGLGGRLPALPQPAAERLQGMAEYGEIAARPLFAEDRQPRPFFLGGNPQNTTSGVRLTGVLMTPGLDMATLTTEQGQSIRLRLGGPAVSGWQLVALQPRNATVSGPGGTQTLELQVFNGQGGTAPTVLADNGQPPPNAASATAAAGQGAEPSPVAPPPLPAPPEAGQPAAGQPATAAPSPTQEQMQAIRERIQARRRQLQQQQQQQNQNPNGSPSGQNQ
ncbi:hypothetical protein OK348_05495 [Flavobacterium sp. MXW15]|uniref:General secretion pathway protein GspN n=1 Tax=Xanthomonas chitinilytica TaxID=2989819 RepID=A0ABT3JSK4_9XANT|nr:general secretion pathway protein GspN [Xanthomonas sp. H13-6]MCW4454243.1 hypothetical protein [Flavobacterium sp. MXW15]MCW4471477.1 general secretion pathway protein GspN [Xanthomonas sp. H13-6]